MGQKYVPSIRDRKAGERYDRRQLKQSKYIKPAVQAKPGPAKEMAADAARRASASQPPDNRSKQAPTKTP